MKFDLCGNPFRCFEVWRYGMVVPLVAFRVNGMSACEATAAAW